jgi:hypothetical protein
VICSFGLLPLEPAGPFVGIARTNSTGPLRGFALALANAPANAQAGATPATPDNAPPSTASELCAPSPTAHSRVLLPA